MSRVLRQPAVGRERLTVAVPDPIAIDPVVRSRVEEATANAYERGFAAGLAAGRQEAFGSAEAIVDAIRGAARDAAGTLAAARRERADEVVALAVEIAEQVLGREPHDGGMVLLERLREAIEHVDDQPLVVHVSPGDVDTVARGLAPVPGVEVEADETLEPGEARVRGPWSRAEVSYARAFQAVREVLGA